MNDALRMQISAFVDGELPENESELLLRRLSQDAELRGLVDDYMKIGRTIRGDAVIPNMTSLRGRIAESLGEEAEATPVVETTTGNRYIKPLAGFAVAASVALVAIFALQQTGGPTIVDTPLVADEASYTQPPVDAALDEMIRHHEASSFGEGVSDVTGQLAAYDTYDIDFEEDGLVPVEPKAELLSPTEISTEVEGDDAEDAVQFDEQVSE